jgi:hypothetical protein
METLSLNEGDSPTVPFHLRIAKGIPMIAPHELARTASPVPPQFGWPDEFVGGKYGGGRSSDAEVEDCTDRGEGDYYVIKDQLAVDKEHLSLKGLASTKFWLDTCSELSEAANIMEREVMYDDSIRNHFYPEGSLSRSDQCIKCINTNEKPSMWIRPGCLLIDTVIVNEQKQQALCCTKSFGLTFGCDRITLKGRAVQLGTRWDPQKVDLKKFPHQPIMITSDQSSEKTGGKNDTRSTFVSDLWFQPDFTKGTVSVSQVKSSRLSGGKRFIYRQNSFAAWEVIKPEVSVLLTDGCSFFLESPSDPKHIGPQSHPMRPEIFTYVCFQTHKGLVTRAYRGKEKRVYSYDILEREVYVPPFEEERSVLKDVVAYWTTASVNRLCGQGVQNVNQYYHDFGVEYIGRYIIPENRRRLRYQIITVDMARGPPQSTRGGDAYAAAKDTRTYEQKFFWAIFEHLYRRYPNRNWTIGQVTGDGNCLFHCLALWFSIMFPHRTYLHYYDLLRQMACDTLMDNIDNTQTPRNTSVGFLELFSQLTELSGSPEEKDLRGDFIPRKTYRMEPEADYKIRVKEYRTRCAANKKRVRGKYVNSVIQWRQNCEFNSEMQLEALAILLKHSINVGTFSESMNMWHGEIHHDISTHVPFDLHTLNSNDVIHIFLDPTPGSQHYVCAIDAAHVAGFQIPNQPPKNTQTHDERGNPRAKIAPKYTNYKRG